MAEAKDFNYDKGKGHLLTVVALKEALAEFPDDAMVMAYEGESICIMVRDAVTDECLADINAPPS